MDVKQGQMDGGHNEGNGCSKMMPVSLEESHGRVPGSVEQVERSVSCDLVGSEYCVHGKVFGLGIVS